ncbi:hypothetical protein [Bacteroides caecimuris]|uniref:pyroglutamyl-peptidase I family protein n=1 Tax=Bacteroides caecimuris TaxID=1796613 RepID=UPI0034A035A6
MYFYFRYECGGKFSKFDVDNLAGQMRKNGYPCHVSNTAGTYVCNALCYHLLNFGIPTLFIHIPLTPKQAATRTAPTPSLPSRLTSEALTELIAILQL